MSLCCVDEISLEVHARAIRRCANIRNQWQIKLAVIWEISWNEAMNSLIHQHRWLEINSFFVWLPVRKFLNVVVLAIRDEPISPFPACEVCLQLWVQCQIYSDPLILLSQTITWHKTYEINSSLVQIYFLQLLLSPIIAQNCICMNTNFKIFLELNQPHVPQGRSQPFLRVLCFDFKHSYYSGIPNFHKHITTPDHTEVD